MLNPFPQLLVFAFFAPAILRLAAAFVYAYLAFVHYRTRAGSARELSYLPHSVAQGTVAFLALIELLVALGLLFGMYTQIAALAGALVALKGLAVRRSLVHLSPLPALAYFLLLAICLSLALSGAGALAHDLPL